eukprot:5073159-Prymnesium_polylepis.1
MQHLRVAYFVLHEGVVQPWPALLLHLLMHESKEVQPAFIELLKSRDFDLIGDPFIVGAEVLYWQVKEQRWNSGSIHKVVDVNGEHKFEVLDQKSSVSKDLKKQHVMSYSTSGVGALLLEAARHGCSTLVQLLLEARVSPFYADHDANTPLMEAARNDHDEVCEYLVGEGADIDLYNRFRANAWDIAVQHKHYKTIRKLKPSKQMEDIQLMKNAEAAERDLEAWYEKSKEIDTPFDGKGK